MNYLEAGDIQKKLNTLDLIVIPEVGKDLLITPEDNIWFPGQGSRKYTREFSKIATYTDLIEITRLWVEGKLRNNYHIPQEEEDEYLLYEILVALLTECKLSETAPPIIPSDKWWSQLESKTRDAELTCFIQSRDTRRILFHIIPYLFDISCNAFMTEMNLQLPERSSIISPEWVEHYLKGDRHTQSWIYHTPMGTGYFLVLFTRMCQYAQCRGCNFHMLGCQNKINSDLINRQVETAICHELLDSEKHDIKEIILSNNGSTFDKRALPPASLLYFISKASHQLPNLKKLVFETRIEHVTRFVLEQIKQALEFDDKNIQVELAVGVEIFDDEARNKHYKKGLRLEQLERIARELGDLGIKLRCYMMYKPLPGMTRKEADEDITKAADYFSRLSKDHNIDLTMHINPTFAAIDTDLAEAFKKGEYTPPDLGDLRQLLHSFEGSKINIYVGLNDEGLAVPGGSFIKPGCEKDLNKLKSFNFTGDFQYLK